MEKLHTTTQQEIDGSKVLRLLAICPDKISGDSKELDNHKIDVDELRHRFIDGDELTGDQVLLVNGEDIINRLPRPEEFGNRALALMDLLDSMPDDTIFTLEGDGIEPLVAAD